MHSISLEPRKPHVLDDVPNAALGIRGRAVDADKAGSSLWICLERHRHHRVLSGGEKQVASDAMVPWIAEFSTSRLSPLGFPLSVPEPPETPTGATAAIGAGSACAATFCGPASSKAGNLCGATCAWGTNSGSALLPWGRGGGLLLLMPKASHPALDNAKTTIRPSATGFPAELCSDRVCMSLLYRKVACVA